ncbi:hypothetical protein J4T94_gp080 [Mycobacterium phage Krypton555]|uniref:Uncharacterized protein n=1 Tax=Mycobacterium phage Krypton555 TaxID=2015885 RepID=A0A222ZQW8_9CAUD|nr:hypothetical protein J4T94_gp080 [Mycobacterium phage Krypton555]ASR87136.1 hypothetical protein KRYPTON555_102 [Mycobacterium phage Krypton555]
MGDEFDPDTAGDDGNLLVAELRIIQYIDADGNLNTVDFSQGAGGVELEENDYAKLLDWARAFVLAPKVAAILAGND